MESLGDRLLFLKRVPWWVWVIIVVATILARLYIVAVAISIGVLLLFIAFWIISIIAVTEVMDDDNSPFNKK